MSSLDLSIIIVNYNTKDLLKDCILSIREHTTNISYEIIVVDNASKDQSQEMIESFFPDVILIANTENIGFSKANNQGIDQAKGEFVLLLNSDTIFIENTLFHLFGFSKKHLEAGLIGCKVLNGDYTLQHSCYHDPTWLTESVFFTKTIIKDFWDPITFWKNMRYWDRKTVRQVEQISGCFMWIRKSVFSLIGKLDEKIFMYYEDAEFCFRLRKQSNLKIYYFPQTKIIHFQGKSALTNEQKSLSSLIQCFHSAQYFLEKCYGTKNKKIFAFLCFTLWNVINISFIFLKFSLKVSKKRKVIKALMEQAKTHEKGYCS